MKMKLENTMLNNLPRTERQMPYVFIHMEKLEKNFNIN